MNHSAKFTVAVHVLTLLADAPSDAMTSEYIAGSVNTNPVVVRRLLAAFRKLGIVTSQPGNGGGWLLKADPKNLTLAQIRTALNEGSPFSMHSNAPNPRCPVGRNIQKVLDPIYSEATRVMEQELARTTIHSLLLSVQSHTHK